MKLNRLNLLLGLFASLAFAGCSKSDGKVSVSGMVTFNGSPLSHGRISLLEVGEGSDSAEIVDGKFKLRTSPGEKNVGVTAFDKVPVTGGREGEFRDHQFIPPSYNEQSTMVVSIDGAIDSLEFELEGDKIEPPADIGDSQRRPEQKSSRPASSRGSDNRRPEVR